MTLYCRATVASAPWTDSVWREISIPITSIFQFITGVQTAEDVQAKASGTACQGCSNTLSFYKAPKNTCEETVQVQIQGFFLSFWHTHNQGVSFLVHWLHALWPCRELCWWLIQSCCAGPQRCDPWWTVLTFLFSSEIRKINTKLDLVSLVDVCILTTI